MRIKSLQYRGPYSNGEITFVFLPEGNFVFIYTLTDVVDQSRTSNVAAFNAELIGIINAICRQQGIDREGFTFYYLQTVDAQDDGLQPGQFAFNRVTVSRDTVIWRSVQCPDWLISPFQAYIGLNSSQLHRPAAPSYICSPQTFAPAACPSH